MVDQPNRRRAPRWKSEVACRYEHEGRQYSSRMFDLSENGAFLESREALPPLHSRLTIHFDSQDGLTEYALEAQVRHRRRDIKGNAVGFGVEFHDVPAEVFAELETIVTRPTFLKKRN